GARRADERVDAAIGDDLHIAVGEQKIDQHAIVVGGIPDTQMRKHVECTLARRLVAHQRRAVKRTLDDEAQLAGMCGLARPDRPLDPVQHRLREHPPQSPAMSDQVLAAALDAHVHQPPDAPPPPRLPPPPENPPSPPPQPPPPPPPTQPPEKPPPADLRTPAWLAARMPSANMVMK